MKRARSELGERLLRDFDVLRVDVERFVDECDEANALLDLADRTTAVIQWDPTRGETLRGALRGIRDRETPPDESHPQ